MAVESSDSQVSYDCDGSTTVFPVPFYFQLATDLTISLLASDGTITPVTSGYEVAGAGSESGGSVTTDTAYASGRKIVISRVAPLTQEVRYQSNNAFPAKTQEKAYDKLTMIAQQHDRSISRSIQFPDADISGASVILPAAAARASKTLIFDQYGNSLVSNEAYVEPSVAADNAKHVAEELDAALPLGSGLGFFLQDGSGAIGRTFQNKGRERKSWGDFVSDLTGATDVTAGIQAALAWVSANGHELVGNPTDRLLFSSALTVPFPAQIDMRGGRFVAAASMTAGYAVTIKNLTASGATNAVEHKRMNIGVQGIYGGESISKPPNLTAAAYNQLDGILIDGSANQITDVDLDIWVEGFRDGLVNGGTNNYLHRMNRIHIGKCWRRGYSILTGTGAGENLSINGGCIFNCVNGDGTAVGIYGSGLQQTSLYCKNLSIDYCDSMYYWNGTDGQLLFDTCHFENGNSNPMGILDTTSSYGQVSLINCTQVFGGVTGYLPAEPATGRPALHKIQGVGNGLFRINGGQIQTYGRGSIELVQNISGIGVDVSTVLLPVQTHQPPLVSASQNRLRNSEFATGDFTGWTQNLSTGQTFSLDPIGDGTYRFKAVGTTSAGLGGITQFTPVRPGQRVIVRAYVQTSGVTNGTANLNARFFDQAGNQISTTTVDGIGSGAAAETLIGGVVVIPDGVALLRTDLFANALVGTAWFRRPSTCVV